ncbi:hypothetical protein [Mycolicibacterium thermoresistibile]
MSDGPSDQPAGPAEPPPAERPRIIRRHPTGAFPHLGPPTDPGGEPQTNLIPGPAEQQTSFIPQPATVAAAPAPPPDKPASPAMAVAAAVVTILSGWATAVIATDLITGWWQTDRLFCVAVGFLAAVSGAAMIGGLILMLLRRRLGRLLTVVGAVIGLLIFGSLFVAGAALAPVVYAIPVLPLISILLTVLPATGRWAHLG